MTNASSLVVLICTLVFGQVPLFQPDTDTFMYTIFLLSHFYDSVNITDCYHSVFSFIRSYPTFNCLPHTGRIKPEDSLLQYPENMTWADFNDLDFVPVFFDELLTEFGNNTLYTAAQLICVGNQQCIFDTLATENVFIGANTKITEESLQYDAQSLGKKTLSSVCSVVLLSTW